MSMPKEQDLTLGLKLKSKTVRLYRPDGTFEILPEEEVKRYVKLHPASRTASATPPDKSGS